MVVVDLCNTVANVNGYLHKLFDVPRGLYPAPTPKGFWESATGLLVFSRAKPIPGAAACILGLKAKLGGLAYVTCRPAASEFVTKRWLRLHGFPEAPVIFCRDALEKVQAARSAGAILALEDDPQAVKGYTDSGITVLMPDWPYNRDVHNPTVVRLKGVVELGYCNA